MRRCPGPQKDEGAGRQLARNVVRCELVIGKTRRQVRALLDQPHGLVAGDHQWSYNVGATNNLFDSDDGHLPHAAATGAAGE